MDEKDWIRIENEVLWAAKAIDECAGGWVSVIHPDFYSMLLQTKQELIRRERKLNKRGIKSSFDGWDYIK